MVVPDCAARARSPLLNAVLHRSPAAAGSTLVEVLAALLILAVGLLALQAAMMASVRASSQAERQTQSVAIGARYLEDGLLELRLGRLPPSFDCVLPGGNVVHRHAQVLEDPNLAIVQVQVSSEFPGAPADSHHVRSYAYSPDGFDPPEAGFSCP